MKILVFGSTGMLGHTLIKYLQNQKSLEVEFTVRDKTKQKICKRYLEKKLISYLMLIIQNLH